MKFFIINITLLLEDGIKANKSRIKGRGTLKTEQKSLRKLKEENAIKRQ